MSLRELWHLVVSFFNGIDTWISTTIDKILDFQITAQGLLKSGFYIAIVVGLLMLIGLIEAFTSKDDRPEKHDD